MCQRFTRIQPILITMELNFPKGKKKRKKTKHKKALSPAKHIYALRWELKVFYRYTSSKNGCESNIHCKWRWYWMMDGSDNTNASMRTESMLIFFLMDVLFNPVQDIQLRWGKVWVINFFPLTLVIMTAKCQQVCPGFGKISSHLNGLNKPCT